MIADDNNFSANEFVTKFCLRVAKRVKRGDTNIANYVNALTLQYPDYQDAFLAAVDLSYPHIATDARVLVQKREIKAARKAAIKAQILTKPPNRKYRAVDGFCLTQLFERGWTKPQIKILLGEPDTKLRSPISFKAAAPMKIYHHARVTAAEAKSSFRPHVVDPEKSRRAKSLAATKRDALLNFVSIISLEIPNIPISTLVEIVCTDFNSRMRDKNAPFAAPDQRRSFLDRICVNYLRHRFSPYDDALTQIKGQVGAPEAKTLLRIRVYEAIAKTYPELEYECYRQRIERKARDRRSYEQAALANIKLPTHETHTTIEPAYPPIAPDPNVFPSYYRNMSLIKKTEAIKWYMATVRDEAIITSDIGPLRCSHCEHLHTISEFAWTGQQGIIMCSECWHESRCNKTIAA